MRGELLFVMKKVFKIRTPAYQNTDIVYTDDSNLSLIHISEPTRPY